MEGEGANPHVNFSPSSSPSPSSFSPVDSHATTNASSPDIPSSPNVVPTLMDLASETSTGTNKIMGATSGRVYSEIWAHFIKEKHEGKDKARCKYCKNLLVGDPKMGTSHLKKHFERCLSRKNKDIRQQVLKANFNKEKFELSPFNFDQEVSRNDLAKAIIVHEYPLTMVDHEWFRKFCNNLNPCFKMVSRNTIKADCMRIYEQERMETMQILEKNEGRVAITTDMWTSSHQKKGFMAVTAHFIDNSWKLQNRIINFMYVPCPHTSEVLCEALVQCLLDWNIDQKLSTITVDNCSTNDAMMYMIMDKLPLDSLLLNGNMMHMRCCAHILNLVVKEGLEAIGDTIEKIRDSVAYWTGTPKRWEKFEETARQLRIMIGKKLMLDCKTRWNSTYLMLQTAIDYKDVFLRLKQRDSKYTCVPVESDWSMTKEICSRLKLFYSATELFSGTKYPTANVYFPKICEIRVASGQWLTCGINVIESMASDMLTKFDKYWSIVHGVMGVATVLDPRYKIILLDFYFQKIYGHNADFEVEKIKILCRELVEQYEEKEKLKEDDYVSCPMEIIVAEEPTDIIEFELFASSKRKANKSELDIYLEEDILPRTPDFDVLSWWKSNKGKYPILHQIAKDILAIPVSTVASESAFSTSGRVIGPHRSRLHSKTVEALMCSQNWLLAKSKARSSESIGHALATIFYDSDDEKND